MIELYAHQKRILEKHDNKFGLFHDCGCLSGDTLIKYNRAKITRTETMERLYIIEKIRGRKRGNIKTFVQSNKNGIVRLNEMVDIFYSGIKIVFELELENGYKIKATKDHKFLTKHGWRTMNKLNIKSDVVATNDDHDSGKRKKLLYWNVDGLWFHPHSRKWMSSNGGRKHATLERHRIVYDAHLNSLSYEDFVKIVRYDECGAKKLKFLNPKKYHIHHIDRDHANDDIKNLIALTPSQHLSIHASYKNFPNTKIKFYKIKSKLKVGYEHTYDIKCKSPHNNYVANGIIVHNSGKTLTSIKLADQDDNGNVLVICPKSLKVQWGEELKKHAKNHERYDVLTKEEFRSKFVFRKVRKRTVIEGYSLRKYNCIIVDEIHNFSGNSKLNKALKYYIKKEKVKYVYGLTATPFTSSPWQVYELAMIFGRQINYYEFKTKYFQDVRMGPRVIPQIRPNMETELARLVQRIGDVVKMEDCFDVPEQIFQVEHFELTADQKRAIDNIDDVVPSARWTKIHQICGGTLKRQYSDNEFFKTEKMDRIVQLIGEHKKIAIICRYKLEIEMIKKKINGKNVFVISGDNEDRAGTVKAIEVSESCVAIIQGACSEGYELPSIPFTVFYSYDFSYKNYKQIKGRFLRANKLKKNVYLSLVVRGTIDEDIFKTVTIKKQRFDTTIYDREIISNQIL